MIRKESSLPAEREFHRQRKAFILFREAGILMGADGFEGSHAELLGRTGLESDRIRDIIACEPRGFALDGDIYLYQGEDFSELSAENRAYARTWLPFFRALGLLTGNGRVFNGMIAGKPGERWTPVSEI